MSSSGRGMRAVQAAARVAIVVLAGISALAGGAAVAGSRTVANDFGFAPGTILIVNDERALYYVTAKGRARRYQVAVGTREELWVGRTFVSMKRENPYWIPVDGGPIVRGGAPDNPLGKRALYLDWSLLRIHGTPSRGSVGRAVSNGCIRMLDEDVRDLYERVHLGAPVIAINRRQDAARFAASDVTGKLAAR